MTDSTGSSSQPDGEAASAFKEWSLICRALGVGRQAILLRKGGIHEGRIGFAFRTDRFFLFPTEFHAQRERVKPADLAALGAGEMDASAVPDGEKQNIEITLFAEAVATAVLTDWSEAAALDPFHVWTEETVRERFEYEDGLKGGSIHLAAVRVFRLEQPWLLPYERRFGGCRSWLTLPPPPADWRDGLVPVLDDARFRRMRDGVRGAAKQLVPVEPAGSPSMSHGG